jgi:hypothetical protein
MAPIYHGLSCCGVIEVRYSFFTSHRCLGRCLQGSNLHLPQIAVPRDEVFVNTPGCVPGSCRETARETVGEVRGEL